jgi:hypothetical protein
MPIVHFVNLTLLEIETMETNCDSTPNDCRESCVSADGIGPFWDAICGPEIRVEKRWVNPAYRAECRWEVSLRISQGMVAHLYETPDKTLALKYARETAERTGLSVAIHDRTN